VHGEEETAAGFAATIERALGWCAEAAVRGQVVEL
jgi:hypothetical protein